jgi:pyridoxal/pyridoxine/pyridoxamine kinase
MAVFVMQSMGCEVAALNTVHFSKQFAASMDKAVACSADR